MPDYEFQILNGSALRKGTSLPFLFFAHLLAKNCRDKPPNCPLIICKFATVSRERLTLRDMAPRFLLEKIPLGRGRLVTVIALCR